jgi:hypothetical protein
MNTKRIQLEQLKELWERNKGDLDSIERLIPRTPDAATKQQLEIQAADKRRGLTEIEGQIDAIMEELGEA